MPYASVHVDMDDFDDKDLKHELESRGYMVSKDHGLSSTGDLDHVGHLAACGLIADAQQEALKIVGSAIGRAIH